MAGPVRKEYSVPVFTRKKGRLVSGDGLDGMDNEDTIICSENWTVVVPNSWPWERPSAGEHLPRYRLPAGSGAALTFDIPPGIPWAQR